MLKIQQEEFLLKVDVIKEDFAKEYGARIQNYEQKLGATLTAGSGYDNEEEV